MSADDGTKCLSLAIIPMVLFILVITQSRWIFQERFSSIKTPKYLMQLQADSSIFFTSRYTYLWKITDILLSGRRIMRFDFFVFKVNLFVVSQSQISLVILFTVCHAWDNYDVSPMYSVLDQQMISLLIFFFILITCLSGIVLVLKQELLSWSRMGV